MSDKLTTPRLWGEWNAAFYPSGTTIVCLKKHQHKPHLYIYADAAIDEDRYARDRFAMCERLAAYMNGGPRPAWLDDFHRESETAARSLAGGQIFATGPMIDSDPPNLNWTQDESEAAKNDRARLMDAVFAVTELGR